MKAVVLEDEAFAANRLAQLLDELAPEIEIIARLESVEESVAWFSENSAPDLVFMDIHLADGSCFEIFEQVQLSCPIIFTTAYDQYAVKAFDVNSISYLLKPLEKSALQKALQKFESARQKPLPFNYNELAQLLKPKTSYKTRFLVTKGQSLVPIETEQIAYFLTKEGVVRLVTQSDNHYPLSQKLEELEKQLNPKDFFRANRQFLVHSSSVKRVHHYFNGKLKVDLHPSAEAEVVISRLKASEFKAWLGE